MTKTSMESFKEWSEFRGVFPRLTHEEIFFAGWNVAAHEKNIRIRFLEQAIRNLVDLPYYAEPHEIATARSNLRRILEDRA